MVLLLDNNEIWTKKIDEFGFGQSVRKLPENEAKVLFYETYFEESNINRKLLIWSNYKIIMKFRPKKWVSFVLEKVYEKCPENKGKVLFYERYFEMGNMNRKQLIWSHYKIITKFGPKKWVSLVLGKGYENCPKIKEMSYFKKPTLKRVKSIKNQLFGPTIR